MVGAGTICTLGANGVSIEQWWRFKPTTIDGKPVAVEINVRFTSGHELALLFRKVRFVH